MHGPTKRAGRSGRIEGIKTPSEVAKLILKYTNHIMLVGDDAKRFALSYGFKEEDLLTLAFARGLARMAGQSRPRVMTDVDAGNGEGAEDARADPHHGDDQPECGGAERRHLVGDHHRAVSRGRSSGRVGDSPIIGAGQ